MSIVRYVLRKPILGKNFVQYPTCKDVNLLAQFGLVRVIFGEKLTDDPKLQVSILDCNTNTLIYKQNGEPFLSSDVIIGRPYRLIFKPYLGGYVIERQCKRPRNEEREVDE